MPFDFENINIGDNITTYSVFSVKKMPDMFLEVEFRYPKCVPWKTCVPIYEKYQGIDCTNLPAEDVKDWIKQCYEKLNPTGSQLWNQKAQQYWTLHPKAKKAKLLFDVINYEDRYHLTSWGCRQCTDTSKVNSQAGSRIRALKEKHGFHIATKDMQCPICNEITTFDLLLRLPQKKETGNIRYSVPNSVKKRTKEIYAYKDACFDEKYSKGTKALILDHKFPATRWSAGETPNYASMTDDEIKKKFQLLTNQTNLQKDRYCFRCFKEKVRGDFFGIKWYPVGDEYWRGSNNSDENGCVGCPWYDLNEWKEKFNEYLNRK